MKKFKLYAGLSGGFGGATYQGTYEYETQREAEEDAYQLAVEQHQSYKGYHGIMSWYDCKEDLEESYPDEEITDDQVDEYYQETMEGWLSYYVVEVNADNTNSEEDED